MLLVLLLASSALKAQVTADSARTDSLRRLTFPGNAAAASAETPVAPLQRTLDAAITGGAGFYNQGTSTAFQSTANLDFFAQTSILDLTAGIHWGFSQPATKSISLGLRFPLTVSRQSNTGIYADAALLFFDNGTEASSFETGLRAAIAARNPSSHLEYRIAAELRQPPFGGTQFQAWGGLELGFFVNLLHEDIREPDRKDSLRAELRYIATSDELAALSRATTEQDLNRWLDAFWAKRDLTPKTPYNEAREEYMRRVALVDRQLSTSHRMGVETDQGRDILIYGEPDRVENAVSDVDPSVHYQLWIYEGRVRGYNTALFLFQTVVGKTASSLFAFRGDYRQIYSNVMGEYTEGVPYDVPATMANYIQTFGR